MREIILNTIGFDLINNEIVLTLRTLKKKKIYNSRMMKLFLQPNDIASLTGFNGNIDIDSLKPIINTAQTTQVKRVLGTKLYDKIYTDLNIW
jgi:hypothetical protein